MPAGLWHDSLKEARALVRRIDDALERLAGTIRDELGELAEVSIFESETALGSRGLFVLASRQEI